MSSDTDDTIDPRQERMDKITDAASMLRAWVQDMRYVLMDIERNLENLEDEPGTMSTFDVRGLEHDLAQLGQHPLRHLNTLIDMASPE